MKSSKKTESCSLRNEISPDIIRKIQAARRILARVGRDKWDEINGCSYTSAEHMIEVCRIALDQAGLALVVRGVRLIYHSEIQVSVLRKFELHDLNKKQEIAYFDFEYQMESSQGQTLTKSLYHFLKDLFLLPRMDEEPKPTAEKKLRTTEELSNITPLPETVNE